MKYALLALVLTAAFPLYAQNDVLDLARADIRTAKMSMVALAMDLDSAQQDAFWPIYNEYAREQDALMAERMEMLSGFAESFSEMSDEQAQLLAKESFAIQRARLERREKYFEKFAEAIGPVLAARFIQVDGQISTLLDFELMRATPLIMPPVEVEVEDN